MDAQATIIFCDNQSAIRLADNANPTVRSKHIDLQYKYVNEKVAEAKVKLKYISTKQQLAGGFTKALPKDKFQAF